MTAQIYRGEESQPAAWSCDRIVEAMRENSVVPRLVPRRFLCQSVRRWAYELYAAEDLEVGPALWIIRRKAVGSRDLYGALTAEGIYYTKNGLEIGGVP